MRMQMEMIRTVIVDDDSYSHEFLYETLQSEHDIEIVGECTNTRDAIESIEEASCGGIIATPCRLSRRLQRRRAVALHT